MQFLYMAFIHLCSCGVFAFRVKYIFIQDKMHVTLSHLFKPIGCAMRSDFVINQNIGKMKRDLNKSLYNLTIPSPRG